MCRPVRGTSLIHVHALALSHTPLTRLLSFSYSVGVAAMAGWAYSNFGDDQQTAQDDQLRQVSARGQLRAMMREDEVNEFRKARESTSPSGPSATPGPAVVPLKPSLSKEKLPVKKKQALVVPSFVKKRSANEAEQTEKESSGGTSPKRAKPPEGDAAAAPAAAQMSAPLAALVGYGDSASDDEDDKEG